MKPYILILSVISVLFLCSCSKKGCELTPDDMDWILYKYDSLYYLKNGKDTVIVPISSSFGQSDYVWRYGIRTEDNDFFGMYRHYLCDSTYYVFVSIKGCRDFLSLSIRNWDNGQHTPFILYKDSVLTDIVKVNNFDYSGYFLISDDKLGIEELIFAKKYGIVKLRTSDSVLHELIPQ